MMFSMSSRNLEKIASSAVRLKIASLVSIRPRTLGELARSSGISVQGVLKHLRKLGAAGIVAEQRITKPKQLGVRKVYSVNKTMVGDYSRENLMLVNLTQVADETLPSSKDVYRELGGLADDALLQRDRIREHARRLGRMIGDLVETETRLKNRIGASRLTEEEKLIAYVTFTEVSEEDAARVLRTHYACKEPRVAILEVKKKLSGGTGRARA